MSETTRSHYYGTFDQVGQALGLKGHLIRAWIEHDSEYIHFVTDNPEGHKIATGGYIDAEPLPETTRIVTVPDEPVEIRVGERTYFINTPVEIRTVGDQPLRLEEVTPS